MRSVNFAGGSSAGLALGVACGALGGFALARLSRQSAALALGAVVGLGVGLGAFLIIFGSTAGFGPETDSGVGSEVGVLLASVGALLGALVVALLRAGRAGSAQPRDASRPPRVVRRAAVGAVAGVICGLAIAAAGWLTFEAVFILPGVAPAYTASGNGLAGRLYGLALLGALGGLIGGLAGALGAVSRWRGVVLAVGLALGLLLGLTLGLAHGDVGGPPVFAQHLTYDPVGSVYGLAGGLLAGALGGIGCALALRWAERQPGRRALLVAAALLALGALLLLEPMWFHPLFGVDIP